LTKPLEFSVAIRKETRKPIRNCDVNHALTTACIEDNCVKRMKGCDRLSGC